MNLNLGYVTLVAGDVLLQREEQTLGVLGRKYYTALDVCLLQSWESSGEVDDKLRG